MTLPGQARLFEAAGMAFFDPFALHARLDFDFQDRSAANGPILIHEYTHYLQSISTIYGLYRVLDWIRTGVRLASVLPSLTHIRIPLQRWWKSEDCPDPLRAQMAEIMVRLRLTDDLEQPELLPNAVIESLGPLHIARVKFSDDDPHIMAVVPLADGRAVPIGARALAEGMAASTQRMWEDTPRLDAILAALEPELSCWYTATRTILGELVGSNDLDFVNAFVCDTAMMTRNPPASFIAAVAAIVGAGATTREAVVSAVREAIPEIVQEEITYTLEDIADTIRRLPGDEPFAQGVRRLLTSSLELLARRIEEPGFPIDVLCGELPVDLEPLLQRYPLPVYFRGSTLLSWHDDEALGVLGEELLMMEHAMSALLFGPRYASECPLTASSSCKVPRTILCSTAPWRIDDTACAFSRVMATFGALGKV